MNKEFNLPETSILEKPLSMEGSIIESKKSFYELAKSKIKYLSSKEIIEWHKKNSGRENYLSTASYVISCTLNTSEDKSAEKLVNALEIVVNRDCFIIDGNDFYDCIPFVIEHEIYEAWLSAKKGAASSLDVDTKHLLAKRKESLMAEKQGLGEKRDRFERLMINPHLREYEFI